ncbi:hypothetical protein A2165_02000 [Candidatus Curtissbacteria bacterium RBG_13_40_7]|uniref:Glycosyltransferase 2-like domain-containing protein n=1 Tax=Candidatus Curtissbacteria bacterium RBG_13_40_7 TaxID=1797706 RepID=A0A1F5FU44_9BACT|nr:MAG: hypothetical protein A2165_02000 [Candidatus Curtissbacteria bacterium RBG_13_40_7]
MKAVIVIPAFNESAVIFRVLKSLPKKLSGVSTIETLVVNDGSTDTTLDEVKKAKVNIISHLLNRGAGAATKTGIDYAKNTNADIVVTFDADGQHNPDDIQKVIDPVFKKRADLVIGSRLLKRQEIPFDRFVLNWIANLITLILFGIFSTDSQSGLRAFSKKAMALIDFKSDRMDFSSEILLEAKRNNLKIVEVPIRAIYTPYSRVKGQKNINALSIFIRFLVKFLG